MDIPAAIEINKAALARIIAGLFALLDGAGEAMLARIPVKLHREIARVLRPAESAVRRLIVVLARITGVKAPPPRADAVPRPVPAGLVRTGGGTSRLSFQLFDPRSRFFRPQRPAKTGPHAGPRILVFGDSTNSPGREPPPQGDGNLNSANLLRRLEALKAALEDLPGQAKRLARALARRQNVPHLELKMPMRPGYAPGYRRKPRLEIDHVLHQCHWLGREALAPDTS